MTSSSTTTATTNEDNNSKSIFLAYLETIPEATLSRLYVDTRTAIAVYKQLSHVAKYVIRRLLLVKGATPFEELRSWHASDFRPKQNPALLQLKHLHILQGRSGEVWLHEEFRQSLLRAFSGDLELEEEGGSGGGGGGGGAVAGLTNTDSRESIIKDLNEYGEQRWEALLYMLVTGSRDERIIKVNLGHLMDVLVGAGLAATASTTTTTPSLDNGSNNQSSMNLSITNKGFQFLLASRTLQLWTLIVQYFEMAEASGIDLVSSISSICRLSLVSSGTVLSSSIPPIIMEFLEEIGLVRKIPGRRNAFHATGLVEQLTLGGRTKPIKEGYIFIETNYKLYAYTASLLQIAILGLFVKLRDRFATMTHGQLTGPSVSVALSKGITADQLITYLRTHIHPMMLKAGEGVPAVIEDQIHLWERDRNRLRTGEGYLYQQFVNEAAFNKVIQEATRLSSVLYVNYQKRLLVLKPEAHPSLKAFIKSESF